MYARKIGNRTLTLRFHPNLLRSNLLLEDLETHSIWSQIGRDAIEGPLAGERLALAPALQTTWADWRARHPDSLVMKPEWGYWPYRYVAPVGREQHGLSRFALVLGLEIGGEAKAYPFGELARTAGTIEDQVGGQAVRIRYFADAHAAQAEDRAGRALPGMTLYWGAWLAFHENTGFWRSEGN